MRHAFLGFCRCSSKKIDWDGLTGSFKLVSDAMKNCGYIIDDSSDHVPIVFYRWDIAPPKHGFIRVSIIELESLGPRKEEKLDFMVECLSVVKKAIAN